MEKTNDYYTEALYRNSISGNKSRMMRRGDAATLYQMQKESIEFRKVTLFSLNLKTKEIKTLVTWEANEKDDRRAERSAKNILKNLPS